MTMPPEVFAAETLAEVIEDRRATLPSDRPPAERTYLSVAGELRAVTYQIAEMAEHEPHQLVAAAEYLHGLLEREPLRSNPAWEPQRVVLGLFLMGLTNGLAAVDVITAEERAALRPAYYRDAVAAVTAAFDSTYMASDDPEEEDPVNPSPTAPELTDDEASALL